MQPPSQKWLDQVVEDIIDPTRRIIDPHHHLYPIDEFPYGLDDLVADTGSGHHVIATVFIECRAAYRRDKRREQRSIGETEFVAAQARELRERFPDAAPIAGIVANVDLTLGDRLRDVLDLHLEASDGLLRGVRDPLASALEPDAMGAFAGRFPPDKAADPAFRAGVAELGRLGMTYESWHYHHQAHDFVELARAAPETTIVLDHFGTPLGVGMYAGRRDEIFDDWAAGISAVADCPNVFAKLGGLAMPDNGFGWNEAERPPTSDEFVEAQARYYHHTIESFGPERCMFESNFPIDRVSLSYSVLWNALKKIAASYTDDEQAAMFEGTARRVYRL